MTTAAQRQWFVAFDGEHIGPFDNEDECYAFAARVSREPNDWQPVELTDPAEWLAFERKYPAS